MKMPDAVDTFRMALDGYDPAPSEVVKVLLTHFKYAGRVYYGGQWMEIDLLLYMVPNYGKASDLRLTFFGGAPGGGTRKYYTGSLLDFLSDVCLWHVSLGDSKKLVYEFIHKLMQEQVGRHELEHRI